MSHYTHLTEGQRYQISALMTSAHCNTSEIARIVGCHRSTIYRELKRNQGKRGYRPKQAHQFATERQSANQTTLTDFFWSYVRLLLERYYSPEQIKGRLMYLGFKGVGSVESIYRYIYRDKREQGDLLHYLRSQNPYRSWERGTNENTNGLIRQFFTEKDEA